MESYRHIPAILPEIGTNIANRTKIRKGSIEEGFRDSDFIIEEVFSFLPGDHVAMEPRITIAEITAQDQVIIRSATQAPFVVRALMADFLELIWGKLLLLHP